MEKKCIISGEAVLNHLVYNIFLMFGSLLLMMLQDLRKLHPFRVVSGRYHAHFPDIAISPTANLDVGELFTWLERPKKQIGRSL